MKPLTIEELKSLEVGDWVWVVDLAYNSGKYIQIAVIEDNVIFCNNSNSIYPMNFYKKNWLAYKNKEQAETKGEIVELQNGWLDTLKLLTCAAMCYADIDDIIARGMANSKELGDLFMKIPRVQGSTLQWSLQDLASSKLDCNKIKGFEEILNAMPRFKERLTKEAERRFAELKGEKL